MPPFLTTLRALDAAATPGPWHPDDGEGYSLLRLVSDSGDTLAHIIGDSAETESNGDILVLLRNAAPRIAALIEAAGAHVALLNAPWHSVPDMEAARYATSRRVEAALAALEAS